MRDETQEFFTYCESFLNREKTDLPQIEYRLDRMYDLMRIAHHPCSNRKIIHIAGSKGKGTTASLIAHILAEHDKTVGLYTSPHILSYRERFSLLGPHLRFLDEYIVPVSRKVKEIAEYFRTKNNAPTTFELLTLTALLLFEEANCEWIVLETGLGGRLDTTNVITPLLSIITSIEKEHQHILGEKLEDIAREKAGIIKEKVPVLLGSITQKSYTVIAKQAEKKKAKLYSIANQVRVEWREEYVILELPSLKKKISSSTLHTESQVHNTALALFAVSLLLPTLNFSQAQRVLKRSRLPARTQFIPSSPPLLLDVAHTALSITQGLCRAKAIMPQGFGILCAFLKEKNVKDIAQIMIDSGKSIILTQLHTERGAEVKQIREHFAHSKNIKIISDLHEAFQEAITQFHSGVMICGSFFLLTELLQKKNLHEGLEAFRASFTYPGWK